MKTDTCPHCGFRGEMKVKPGSDEEDSFLKCPKCGAEWWDHHPDGRGNCE